MKIDVKVTGLREATAQMRARGTASEKDSGSVIVGFTAAYALFVHENMEMKLKGQPRTGGRGNYWDPQGIAGPKFLEGPARELSNSGELGRVLRAIYEISRSLMKSLLAVGMRIQREAQQRVPVDTGNLKNSAFTRQEK